MSSKTIIHDAPNPTMDKKVEGFFRLTREALDTDSAEDFFNALMERETLFSSSEQISASLSPEHIAKMLFIERKILERLESKKRKIIRDIDKLSRQMKTARAYSVKFPFPTMPAFFDQAR
jgi:hypothetical protein